MKNTIIVFFSDNGGVSWGGKDSDTEGLHEEHRSVRFQADMAAPPTSNLPLRNGKASLYEGGVREPCMVVWPGVTRPGTVNETIIQSIDWMPTLLSMVGVPLPKEARPDGVDFSSALKGGKLKRDAIFCHFPHDTPASGQHPGASVRRGDWKLIRLFAGNADGSDKLELYNLREDLGEHKDRAAEKPKLARELNNLISGFLKETDAVIPKLNPNYNPNALTAKPANAGAAAGLIQGWTQRQCVAAIQNGAMTVKGAGPAPFLGMGASTRGPGEVRLRARCAAGGGGKIEWFPAGKPPTENAQSLPFKLAAGEWQEVTVKLPQDASIGILRVYLPAQKQPVEVQWIELQSAGKSKRWEFK